MAVAVVYTFLPRYWHIEYRPDEIGVEGAYSVVLKRQRSEWAIKKADLQGRIDYLGFGVEVLQSQQVNQRRQTLIEAFARQLISVLV